MTAATRRWAKTDATQQRILDAATDVFAARGFTAALAHRAPFSNAVP